MIRLGIVLFSAGLLLLSQVNAVATFYTSAILMAVGASLSGYFPLSVALVQWFEKFRARALSIMSLGLAMGGLVVPLMAWSIQHWGWRYTAGGTGLLVLLFGLPLAGMILRRPEDHGQHVDGIDPALKAAEQGDSPVEAQVEFTAKEAVQTRAFWMLAIGHGLALLIVSAVNVHAITHMKEGLGYSVATASWVILFMTFAQLGGVLLGATLGDMFEKRKVVFENDRLQERMNLLFDKLESTFKQSLRDGGPQSDTPTVDAQVTASLLVAFMMGRMQRFARSGFKRLPSENLQASLARVQ
jgi:sugar phosphate permease